MSSLEMREIRLVLPFEMEPGGSGIPRRELEINHLLQPDMFETFVEDAEVDGRGRIIVKEFAVTCNGVELVLSSGTIYHEELDFDWSGAWDKCGIAGKRLVGLEALHVFERVLATPMLKAPGQRGDGVGERDVKEWVIAATLATLRKEQAQHAERGLTYAVREVLETDGLPWPSSWPDQKSQKAEETLRTTVRRAIDKAERKKPR
jgi:hypothetical protein